jgi:hypothetical protein
MGPQSPDRKKGSGRTLPGKKAVVEGAILCIVVIIGVIAFVVLVQPPAGNTTTPTQAVVATTKTPAIPQPVRQSVAQAPSVTARQTVAFALATGPLDNCGLTCRQLAPSITNTGTETAHNVCISLAMYNSGGDLIFLNGGPSIRQCVGTLAAGESKSEPIVINADCGFLASKCLQQTLLLKTLATSDETTVRFPDLLIAV